MPQESNAVMSQSGLALIATRTVDEARKDVAQSIPRNQRHVLLLRLLFVRTQSIRQNVPLRTVGITAKAEPS